ncbi:hypothetical protein [Aequorivita sp. Q41]|uniref:hypothetical protein n=1 Tax=Aequorivita sp. Q41 TaxID=3153300 RepID=UPI00324259C3
MKKFKKFAISIAAVSTLFLVGCGSDDDFTSGEDDPIENTQLTGALESDRILDPSVQYTVSGAYLVKSGAKLTIPAGTVIVSQVGTDKYIAVEQGGKIDIQGTSSSPVVMRSESNNPGDWGGLLLCGKAKTTEGVNVIAEVGGLIYGGTDDADNSGSIEYLIIKNAGAQINTDSQYNGLTLYSVGSGTHISNIAVLDGADDGVEFFGGTVSATNLYFENNEDDSVDWTEGWNGTITNTYVSHSAPFSTAIEADGDNNNPKVVNFTAVSTVGGTALQFKKQSGATIDGLSLLGYNTRIDMKDNGPLANVIIDGEAADPSKGYNAPATVDLAMFAWATSNNSDTSVLPNAITGTTELDASVVYLLQGTTLVKSGGKLVIPAGTIIISETGTDKYIAVEQGGEIEIKGTNDNPVVMKSAGGNPGDWGGLLLCGEGITTEGIDAIAEVGGLVYGGNNNSDSSGSIDYLVIRGAGAQINTDSQYNGLTLYSVGSGTHIANVAVIDGADDGIEFFGGAVSATNLYFENNEDDSVDWTEGWNGTITNTYVSHSAAFSTAIEADGDNNNPKIVNFTAVSTVGGTALQFKKQSGATFTNILLTDYATNVDMKDNGPLANVIVDGTPLTTPQDDVFNGTAVDISGWNWISK